MEKLNFTDANRKDLGFVDSVEAHFNFLVENYGFKRTESNNYYVCFKMSEICIEIYHERISYEIYLNIIKKSSKRNS